MKAWSDDWLDDHFDDAGQIFRIAQNDKHDGEHEEAEIEYGYAHDLALIRNLPSSSSGHEPLPIKGRSPHE